MIKILSQRTLYCCWTDPSQYLFICSQCLRGHLVGQGAFLQAGPGSAHLPPGHLGHLVAAHLPPGHLADQGVISLSHKVALDLLREKLAPLESRVSDAWAESSSVANIFISCSRIYGRVCKLCQKLLTVKKGLFQQSSFPHLGPRFLALGLEFYNFHLLFSPGLGEKLNQW